MVVETLGRQVFQVVSLSVVILSVPDGLIELVSVVKVESVGFIVDWEHGVGVQVHNVEAWGFALVSGSGSNDVVHADWLLEIDINCNLILFLMDVRIHTPSDYSLISIHDSMISSSKFSGALINIWNMSKDNRCSIYFLESLELILKPLEHVSRVSEVGHGLPVVYVADVSVQRDYLGLFISDFLTRDISKIKGIESKIQEVFLLLLVWDPLEPIWGPFIDGSIVSWCLKVNNILWISVMISNSWEYSEILKSIRNDFGSILHDLNITVKIKRIYIMGNRISTPKDYIRFNVTCDVLKHIFKGQLIEIAFVVSPLLSSHTIHLRKSTVRSAAQRLSTVVGHTWGIIEVHMKVTDKSYFDILLVSGSWFL